MMMSQRAGTARFRKTQLALLTSCTLLLAACGGGGGSSSSSGSAAPSATVAGTANKGVLQAATVTAYAINSGVAGAVLSTAVTSATGTYSIDLGSYSGAVLIKLAVTPGTTTMICDVPTGCPLVGGGKAAFGVATPADPALQLETVIPAASGTVSTALTPFTTLATEYAKTLGGGLTATNIGTALTQTAAVFNLPDLNSTQPVDITGSGLASSTLDVQHYTVLDAALAQLAASKSETVSQLLANLIAEFTTGANKGQLIANTSGNTTKPALADLLDAASTVALDSHVKGHLNPTLIAAVGLDLSTAQAAAPGTATQATPAPLSGASDLAKAKAFVSNAHSLVQSLIAYDSASLDTALQARYAPLSAVLGNQSTASHLVETEYLINSFLADRVLVGNGATADYTNDDFQTWLDANYNQSVIYGFGDTQLNASGFTFKVDGSALTAKVTHQGSLAFQPMTLSCTTSCTSVSTGTPDTVTASTGLGFQFPDGSIAVSTYTATLLAAGSLVADGVTLNLASSGPSTVSATWNGNSTLSLPALKTAKLADKATLNLSNITLQATDASNHTATFTGSVHMVADKVSLPVILDGGGNSGTEAALLPDQLQLNGSFAYLSDTVSADVSLVLDTSVHKPGISPLPGYVHAGLFTYQYDAASDTATLTTNTAQGPKVSTVSLTTGFYYGCAQGQQVMEFTDPYVENSVYVIGCTSASTVPAALKELDWGRNAPYNYFSVYVIGEGYYLPVKNSSFDYTTATPVTVGGVNMYGNYGDPVPVSVDGYFINPAFFTLYDDATNFSVVSMAANINASVTAGGVTTTGSIRLQGSRTAFRTGSAQATFTVNGTTVTLSATDTSGVRSYTVTDQNGVAVQVSPSADLNGVAITVNGQQQGTLTRAGGAVVARFSDNSLMAL